MTSPCAPATAAPSPSAPSPDPTKHVRYTLGMILGADDFDQEFAWLSGRDRWLARDAVGYGTLSGLQVTMRQGPGVPAEVQVSPGSALTPRGELVRVCATQCALLDGWLAANADRVRARWPASPPAPLPLYVVLCHATCETDQRPIPGEPCRTEAETMAPSRVQDAFRLELRLDPPAQDEERAVRAFVHWLRGAVAIGGAASTGSAEEFAALVRAAWAAGIPADADPGSPPWEPWGSPPDSPPGSPPASPPGSPPDGPSSPPGSPPDSPPWRFAIADADACDHLRTALRVWATELRPRWQAAFDACDDCAGQTSPTPATPEPCLLLARLDVALGPDGRVAPVGAGSPPAARPVTIVEDDRPVLAHLRLLQEWLTCGPGVEGAGGGGVQGPPGPRGLPGADGRDGRDGRDGTDGRDGVDGAPGRDGVDGAPGRDGTDGTDGAAGRDADASTLRGLFVEIPPDTGFRYFVVAAGTVAMRGGREPVFGKLRVVDLMPGGGLVMLTYDGYRAPKERDDFQTIVKVLPVLDRQTQVPFTVNFVEFADRFFVVRVSDPNGRPVDGGLERVELMVEVSQFVPRG